VRQVEFPPRRRGGKLLAQAVQMIDRRYIGHIAILVGMEEPVAMRWSRNRL
jgi:transposase-like protein